MGLLDLFKKQETLIQNKYFDVKSGKEYSEKEFNTMRESLWDQLTAYVTGYHSKFVSDVYNDTILETHEEKVRAKKAYDYDSYVATAVDTYSAFVIGGDTFFKTDNENLDQIVNDLYNDLGLKQIIETYAVVDLKVDGDCYAERIKGSSGFIEQYEYVPNPELIYADFDKDGSVKRWAQRIPDGQVQDSSDQYLDIIYYGKNNHKYFRGIVIDKGKLFHMKLGKGLIPFYGRGSVSTIINDYLIGNEIDRSFAIMARYYALKKKLIQVKGGQPKDLQNLRQQIGSTKDYENAMTGYESDIMIQDLVGTGAPQDLGPIVDYNKKKKTVGLAPDFIMHGEDTNRATSREQIEGFYLRANQTRSIIANFVEDEMKRVLEERHIPYKKIKLMFQNIFSENQEIKVRLLLDAWRANAITLGTMQNELAKYFDIVVDEELQDAYFSDVGGTDPISDVLKKQLGTNEQSKTKSNKS